MMRVGEEKAERCDEALIDLSEAITTSSEQKIGRRRLAASSAAGIRDSSRPSPVRELDLFLEVKSQRHRSPRSRRRTDATAAVN